MLVTTAPASPAAAAPAASLPAASPSAAAAAAPGAAGPAAVGCAAAGAAPANGTAPAAAALRALLQAADAASFAADLADRDFYAHCPLNHADFQYNATVFHAAVIRSLAQWRAGGGLTARAIDKAFSTKTANTLMPMLVSVRGGHVSRRTNDGVDYQIPYDGHIVDMVKAAAALAPPPPDSEFIINPWDHPKVPVSRCTAAGRRVPD